MTTAKLGTVTLSSSAGRALLSDTSCGRCSVCLSGQPVWCSEPRHDAVTRLEWSMDAEANAVLTALACVAAFARAEVPTDHAVLVLGDESCAPLSRLIERVHGGAVFMAEDPRDPQVTYLLASNRPTGRADTVVTTTRVRAAVKAVRRGGRVCAAASDDIAFEMPSITEVVQREVAIVGAADVVGAALEIGPEALTELFSLPGNTPS